MFTEFETLRIILKRKLNQDLVPFPSASITTLHPKTSNSLKFSMMIQHPLTCLNKETIHVR